MKSVKLLHESQRRLWRGFDCVGMGDSVCSVFYIYAFIAVWGQNMDLKSEPVGTLVYIGEELGVC